MLTWSSARAGQPVTELELWPGTAPGEKGLVGEERDTTKETDRQVAERPVVRVGNVSKPTLAVYRPAPEKNTGAAVVVCPGGGYSILALDLEGSEVCEWLNSIGVTGILLKYRVPKREGLEKHTPPLQDLQRAFGMVRQRAGDWGIDAGRIGVLGFSAGGHLAAVACNQYQTRTYPGIDESDKFSCRPDFAILIYPAYLTLKEEHDKVAPELTITSNTPPTFLVMAEDDPVRVENVFFYALALKKEKVPFELHVYPSGGHGYGLRPSKDLVTTWPQRAEEWMRSCGWLSRR